MDDIALKTVKADKLTKDMLVYRPFSGAYGCTSRIIEPPTLHTYNDGSQAVRVQWPQGQGAMYALDKDVQIVDPAA